MSNCSKCDGCGNFFGDDERPKVELTINDLEHLWRKKHYDFHSKECFDKFIVLNGDLI